MNKEHFEKLLKTSITNQAEGVLSPEFSARLQKRITRIKKRKAIKAMLFQLLWTLLVVLFGGILVIAYSGPESWIIRNLPWLGFIGVLFLVFHFLDPVSFKSLERRGGKGLITQ